MTENTGNTDTANIDTTAVAAVDTANEATVDILGGTDAAVATAETTADTNETPVATTPGKASRQRNGEKRDYTPRGTTYWARRVILLNGAPVGRGRPAKDGKGERKVVYVPVGMEYDVAVHGEGVKYNTHSHRATHKRIAKDSVNYVFDDGVAPAKTAKTAKTKTVKAKTVKGDKGKVGKKTAKTTKTAKTVKAKSPKKAKAKDVTVPVADVSAPVDAPASTEIPASTDAVTA